jgi:eukaryotic-like serine/threonine-protein kinase
MAPHFDFKERLGAGHFGEVWRAIDIGLNTVRAVKVIPRDKVINPANFFHEAQILKAVEHPNIVKVEETGEFDDGRVYVAMEFLPKGSLEDEAKGTYIELTRAKRLMIDVLRGLEHAHTQNVLHRDIKPANILIGKNNEGKLSDFGLAISKGVNLKSLGMKDYVYILHLAPEVSGASSYSVQADIYACGITLYRLINGDNYLPTSSPNEARKLALKGRFPDRNVYREFVPRPLRSLINKAIHIKPSKRFLSATEMRRALERLRIEKNWNERILASGQQWTCGWNKRCYEVSRKRSPDRSWSVAVRKGTSKNNLRKIIHLCSENLSKSEAERTSRRILQDFVLGRLN